LNLGLAVEDTHVFVLSKIQMTLWWPGGILIVGVAVFETQNIPSRKPGFPAGSFVRGVEPVGSLLW